MLDTCDREIIAWEATTGGFTGETVRNLMLMSVEKRFGQYHTPQAVQWLTDNGSAYTAKEMIDFGQQLGLTPCFTPVRSPQSNGMAEAFVKTLSETMSISTIVPTQKWSWRSSTVGLMTTITITPTRG